MGRTRHIQVGSNVVLKDRGKYNASSEKSVTDWADRSPGIVASTMWGQRLLTYDSEGELRIDRAAVRREVEALNAVVVATREYDKATFTRYAVEATGLTPQRALNATDREFQARAQAVLIAAKAAGVPITPAEKRVLNPLEQGRFVETVYGKKSQFESGTLNTRLRALKKEGGRWRDAGYRARAKALADQLHEYRYERVG